MIRVFRRDAMPRLSMIRVFRRDAMLRKFQKNNYPKRQFKPVCLISLILCGSARSVSRQFVTNYLCA